MITKICTKCHIEKELSEYSCFDQIATLGENARRLLEIGIVQDRLVELGFEAEHHSPSAEFKIIYSFIQHAVKPSKSIHIPRLARRFTNLC